MYYTNSASYKIGYEPTDISTPVRLTIFTKLFIFTKVAKESQLKKLTVTFWSKCQHNVSSSQEGSLCKVYLTKIHHWETNHLIEEVTEARALGTRPLHEAPLIQLGTEEHGGPYPKLLEKSNDRSVTKAIQDSTNACH